jgi:hypothetical protein
MPTEVMPQHGLELRRRWITYFSASPYRLAQRDFEGATGSLSDVEARIRELKATRTHGLPHLISDVNDRLMIAYGEWDNTSRAIAPFGVVEREARARAAAAQTPVANADMRIAQAAAAAVCDEAALIARAHLVQLQQAFATILAVGPDLACLSDKRLLPADLASEIESAAGGLLRKARAGWPEFDARCQHSPWRTAQQLLQDDSTAALPQAATS